jgi:hypothetical protein
MYAENSGIKICAVSAIKKTLPNANNLQIGENSPNLVTMTVSALNPFQFSHSAENGRP